MPRVTGDSCFRCAIISVAAIDGGCRPGDRAYGDCLILEPCHLSGNSNEKHDGNEMVKNHQPYRSDRNRIHIAVSYSRRRYDREVQIWQNTLILLNVVSLTVLCGLIEKFFHSKSRSGIHLQFTGEEST